MTGLRVSSASSLNDFTEVSRVSRRTAPAMPTSSPNSPPTTRLRLRLGLTASSEYEGSPTAFACRFGCGFLFDDVAGGVSSWVTSSAITVDIARARSCAAPGFLSCTVMGRMNEPGATAVVVRTQLISGDVHAGLVDHALEHGLVGNDLGVRRDALLGEVVLRRGIAGDGTGGRDQHLRRRAVHRREDRGEGECHDHAYAEHGRHEPPAVAQRL